MSVKEEVKKIINEKISEEDFNEIIKESIDKTFKEAVNKVFGSYGDVVKVIEGKLKEVILPSIERYNYSKYIPKIDSLLTEIINHTNLCDNQKILRNFKDLMIEPDCKEISLSKIFKLYCEYVSEYVETSVLGVIQDGEVHYQPVNVHIKVDDDYEMTYLKTVIVEFICEEDDSLNKIIRLNRWKNEDKWQISNGIDTRIESLRGSFRQKKLHGKLQRKIGQLPSRDVLQPKKPEQSRSSCV